MKAIAVLVAMSFALACDGAGERIAYVQPADLPAGYGVGPSEVCLPLGRVLLVRRDGRLYGLRLIKAVSNREKSAFSAVFDVSTFTAAGWETRVQGVEERPLRGVGHPFMFQTGNTRLAFGTFVLSFHGPSCVNMSDSGSEQDGSASFAPTGWRSFSEVDVRAAGLRWYRVDLNRSVDVALTELPGGA